MKKTRTQKQWLQSHRDWNKNQSVTSDDIRSWKYKQNQTKAFSDVYKKHSGGYR